MSHCKKKRRHYFLQDPVSNVFSKFKVDRLTVFVVELAKCSPPQEFASGWMSIEIKSIWKVHVINECYIYCFSLS